MKKIDYSLALIGAIVATLAQAAQAGQAAPTPVGTVAGVATSTVNGSVGSASVIFGLGQSASHAAQASAQNCTTITGISTPGANGATASTNASTAGQTFAQGSGVGSGFSYANAAQFGSGNITSTAGIVSKNVTGSVDANSGATVGTFSGVSTVDTGNANAGTEASAFNRSAALAGSNTLPGGVSVRTDGSSNGADSVRTYGSAGPGAISNAGGSLILNGSTVNNVGAIQGGAFNATITRNVDVSVKGTAGGPSGCVTPSGNGCKE